MLAALASLASVDDAAPAEVRVDAVASTERRAAPAPAVAPPEPSDGEVAAERVESFSSAERPSRRAVVTTTAAPTTTTAAPTTTSAPKPKPTTTTAKQTTTTAKATTTTAKATTTTAKPTTTTAAPATTTTAKAATTTSTMGPQPACCRQEGGASYHDYPDIRTCAHRSLPKGTALKVTNLGNGKTTTCVVNDRGPYVEGRILDLSREAFSEIAPITAGVIRVSIEW